jgi:predicted nucleic acid-binding protein
MTNNNKPVYVIDASLVLKWFCEHDEEDLEKARLLRNKYLNFEIELVCPELLIYEVCNVLRYKKILNDYLLEEAILSIYNMDFLYSATENIMQQSVKFAKKYDITVYDATYLGFSNHYNALFITADKKLYRLIKENSNVILLKDYEN